MKLSKHYILTTTRVNKTDIEQSKNEETNIYLFMVNCDQKKVLPMLKDPNVLLF